MRYSPHSGGRQTCSMWTGLSLKRCIFCGAVVAGGALSCIACGMEQPGPDEIQIPVPVELIIEVFRRNIRGRAQAQEQGLPWIWNYHAIQFDPETSQCFPLMKKDMKPYDLIPGWKWFEVFPSVQYESEIPRAVRGLEGFMGFHIPGYGGYVLYPPGFDWASWPALPSVFIGYAHEDRDVARRIWRGLERRGCQVLIDQGELGPGDSIVGRLSDAIAAANFMVVLVSESSVGSSWCQWELERALERQSTDGGIAVLPIRVGSVVLPGSLKDVFVPQIDPDASEQAVEALSSIIDRRLRDLAQRTQG